MKKKEHNTVTNGHHSARVQSQCPRNCCCNPETQFGFLSGTRVYVLAVLILLRQSSTASMTANTAMCCSSDERQRRKI